MSVPTLDRVGCHARRRTSPSPRRAPPPATRKPSKAPRPRPGGLQRHPPLHRASLRRRRLRPSQFPPRATAKRSSSSDVHLSFLQRIGPVHVSVARGGDASQHAVVHVDRRGGARGVVAHLLLALRALGLDFAVEALVASIVVFLGLVGRGRAEEGRERGCERGRSESGGRTMRGPGRTSAGATTRDRRRSARMTRRRPRGAMMGIGMVRRSIARAGLRRTRTVRSSTASEPCARRPTARAQQTGRRGYRVSAFSRSASASASGHSASRVGEADARVVTHTRVRRTLFEPSRRFAPLSTQDSARRSNPQPRE